MLRTLYLLIGLAVLAVVSKSVAADSAASPKKQEPIRKLTVEVDQIAGSQWSAKPGIRVASDEKELTKLLGKAIAKQIAGQIDFAKEKVVHVAWGSSGPPFDTLQHESKKDKEGDTITFYIQEPKVAVRGQAFRIGNDFFAVPKKSQVSFRGSR